MAKISVVGGYTDATDRAFVSPADVLRARGKLGPYKDAEPKPEPDEDTAEEASWRGSSSETSPEKPPKPDARKKPSPPRRAPTTGNRSGSTGVSGTASAATTSGPATDD